MVDGKLDDKDLQILNLLTKEARMSYSDIGEHVSLTRTAVKNRVVAMEKAGIIKGYHADIALPEPPEMTTFVAYIEPSPEHFEEAKAALVNVKEAATVFQKTGSCKLVALCTAKDSKALKNSLDRLFKEVPGIDQIYAHIVLDVFKGAVIPDNLLIEVLANDDRAENDGVNQ